VFGKTERCRRSAAALFAAMLLVFSLAGCGRSNNPEAVSDDDLYRAEARAEGVNEDNAVLVAHRHLDEDPLRYLDATKKLRLYIKYYKDNAGDCTLDEYVALETKKREGAIEAVKAEREHAAKVQAAMPEFLRRCAEYDKRTAPANEAALEQCKKECDLKVEAAAAHCTELVKSRDQAERRMNEPLKPEDFGNPADINNPEKVMVLVNQRKAEFVKLRDATLHAQNEWELTLHVDRDEAIESFQGQQRQKRKASLLAIANELGLDFSPDDPRLPEH
jgi:hypothetical protein